MKRKTKNVFAGSLLTLLMVLAPSVVVAQTTGSNTEDSSQMLQTTAQSNENTDQSNANERQARLTERKAKLQLRLDSAKQNRLRTRCQASQGKLKSLSGRIQGLQTSRSEVYSNLLQRLTVAGEKLAAKAMDVSLLNEQITHVSQLIDVFNEQLGEYKQAVADIAEMDCGADPTAFQASLQAAREARSQVVESSVAIKQYLKDTLKPTLVTLKTQVSSGSSNE